MYVKGQIYASIVYVLGMLIGGIVYQLGMYCVLKRDFVYVKGMLQVLLKFTLMIYLGMVIESLKYE